MSNHILVGKIIKEIFLADDREAIKFVLDDGGEIIAYCDADCCSNTWIEDIVNFKAAIGHPVLHVEDLELPEQFKKPTKTNYSEEEMKYYGLKIQTAKGDCIIAYRNSSNGYYGGLLVWPEEYFYGGVFGQNKSKEKWMPINDQT